MKLPITPLTAALSLIMSALSAQTGHAQSVTTQTGTSASIQISALPFSITAPGTYVLTGNLSPSVPNVPAISISTALTGPVVIDLKGFTITANAAPNQFQSLISLNSQQTVSNTFPITIKNGTLATAAPASGITAIANSDMAGAGGVGATDVTIDNVVIIGGGGNIGIFGGVAFSTISNCTFIGDMGIAIFDRSALGNLYLNDTFEGPRVNIRVDTDAITLSQASFSSAETTPTPTATPTATAPPTALARIIKISSLPFNITAPGTYVLTGNLDASAGGINISTALAGPVFVDLKGFTILGNHRNPTAINIGAPLTPGIANTFPITLRNGTIQYSPQGLSASASPAFISHLTINNIDFISSNVSLGQVNSSLVIHCTFDGSEFADGNSVGGNRYIDDNFFFPGVFVVASRNITVVNRCIFSDTRPPTP
jgi:hypothetical protein